MKQYLLTPPDTLDQARTWGLPVAHLAFQIGPEGRLSSWGDPARVREGLMLTGLSEAPEEGDPGRAAGEILSLCRARSFQGVILDLEAPPTPWIARLIRLLEEGLTAARRGLFLPEAYANYSGRALLYLSSALSGGSLEERLEEAVRTYGPDRLALSLHRAREDFFLPAPGGEGRSLSKEALERLVDRLEPRIHFSPDLCARYFTYMSRETGAHFVLLDDRETLERKRALARQAGIRRFLWFYPEVADLGPEIVR